MLTETLHEVQGLGEPSPDATITSYQVGLLEYVGILVFSLVHPDYIFTEADYSL